MAPLSKLPGRLRLEIKELVSKRCYCRVLELKILEVSGVTEAEANHRTGRLLVVFNGAVIDSRALVSKIREILDEMVECDDNESWVERQASSEKRHARQSNAFVHAAIEIAGHMFMPKPLGFLIPLAVNAMRKNL